MFTAWAPWSSWSSCSVTCEDDGNRSRTRACTNGEVGDPGCIGQAHETISCNDEPCPSKLKI